MHPKQKILALVMAVGLLIFIIETVRRRKLREEYAWLWVLIGIIILVLSLWEESLRAITGFLGIELPINTVFFFGLMFVVFINLHFSVKISQLTNQVKRLTQELAIKREEGQTRKSEHRTSNVERRTSNDEASR
jgi:hypothetical protein